MKKTAIRICAMLLCICICCVSASGAEYLLPGGQVIGLELSDGVVKGCDGDGTVG